MSISKRIEDVLFLRKMEELGLTPMWDYIVRTNPGKVNPYHNTEHMFQVAKLAWKIWSVEVGEQDRANDHHDFTLKTLLIACLWHDYDHSAGMLSDRDNISTALAALDNWRAMPEYHDVAEKVFEGVWPTRVGELVYVTEFPFIHEPRYMAEKIIRDADLLYSFCDETGSILKGLYDELNSSGKLPTGFGFAHMVKGQTDFHDKVQLFTRTGLMIHKDQRNAVIKEQHHFGQELEAIARHAGVHLPNPRTTFHIPLPKEDSSE